MSDELCVRVGPLRLMSIVEPRQGRGSIRINAGRGNLLEPAHSDSSEAETRNRSRRISRSYARKTITSTANPAYNDHSGATLFDRYKEVSS